jgi:nuclear cap-binding protein subunit 1
MLERYDDGDEEKAIVMQWGERWARVWRRKAAVEETVVGEAAVPELVEPAPELDTVADAGMDVADDIV